MIERINLIEKEALQFTYTKLVQGGVIVVGFCVLLYGFQMFRVIMSQRKIEKIRVEIIQLQEEQKRLAQGVPIQVKEGAHPELQRIFTIYPKWSDLMTDIAKRLPPSVWLNVLKASAPAVPVPKSGVSEPDKKAANSAPAANQTGTMILSGSTDNISNLTEFVSNLQESPFIKKAQLTNSKKEETRFLFEINCEITTK